MAEVWQGALPIDGIRNPVGTHDTYGYGASGAQTWLSVWPLRPLAPHSTHSQPENARAERAAKRKQPESGGATQVGPYGKKRRSRYAKTRAPADGLAAARAKKAEKKSKQKEQTAQGRKKINKNVKKGKGCGRSHKR